MCSAHCGCFADALAFKLTIHCFFSSLYSTFSQHFVLWVVQEQLPTMLSEGSCINQALTLRLDHQHFAKKVQISSVQSLVSLTEIWNLQESFQKQVCWPVTPAGYFTCCWHFFLQISPSGICTGIEVHELRTWRHEPRYQCLFLLLIVTGVFHNRFTVRNVQYCL